MTTPEAPIDPLALFEDLVAEAVAGLVREGKRENLEVVVGELPPHPGTPGDPLPPPTPSPSPEIQIARARVPHSKANEWAAHSAP